MTWKGVCLGGSDALERMGENGIGLGKGGVACKVEGPKNFKAQTELVTTLTETSKEKKKGQRSLSEREQKGVALSMKRM